MSTKESTKKAKEELVKAEGEVKNTVKVFELPEQVIVKTLQYLLSKPAGETMNLITEIKSSIKPKE